MYEKGLLGLGLDCFWGSEHYRQFLDQLSCCWVYFVVLRKDVLWINTLNYVTNGILECLISGYYSVYS